MVYLCKSQANLLLFARDYILAFDQDSNDSYSNWSNCDMSITDNFFATTTATAATAATAPINAATTTAPTLVNPLTSRSPNPKR